MSGNKNWIAGVDIGGTKIRVALVPRTLDPVDIKPTVVSTPKDAPGAISETVCELLEQLLTDHGVQSADLAGIGLATAGPLDLEKGEIFNNANLGFDVIPLREPVKARFPDAPLFMANDCNAAVLGVHYFEADPAERANLAYVTISTGIGGGAIVNGRLLLGKEGNAAEIGHVRVEPHSCLQCNCGAKGCWEVYSSGTGVAQQARMLVGSEEYEWPVLYDLTGGDADRITAVEVFKAARRDDPLAQKVLRNCIFYNKVGLGLVNTVYDCAVIYLGGAMMNDDDLLLPPLVTQFRDDPLAFTINHPPVIKKTALGDEVGIRGALALVKYALEGHPVVRDLQF